MFDGHVLAVQISGVFPSSRQTAAPAGACGLAVNEQTAVPAGACGLAVNEYSG